MMKYGGKLEVKLNNNLPQVQEEYRTISSNYLNEIFSHRDEYQMMFEEYFQKYTAAKGIAGAKDADLKRARQESDIEINYLKALLVAKEKENSALTKDSVAKDIKIARLSEELSKSLEKNIDLEREVNIAEAKVECIYQKKMAEEDKSAALASEIVNLEKQVKGYVTTKCILQSQIDGKDKCLHEYQKEVALKDEKHLKTSKHLTALSKQINELESTCKKILELNSECEDLRKNNIDLECKLKECNSYGKDMHDMINNLFVNNGQKKCFPFQKQKQSKKVLLLHKLKHMLEKKYNIT